MMVAWFQSGSREITITHGSVCHISCDGPDAVTDCEAGDCGLARVVANVVTVSG